MNDGWTLEKQLRLLSGENTVVLDCDVPMREIAAVTFTAGAEKIWSAEMWLQWSITSLPSTTVIMMSGRALADPVGSQDSRRSRSHQGCDSDGKQERSATPHSA